MKLYKTVKLQMRGPVPTRPARQAPNPEREDPQTDPEEDKPHTVPKRRKAEEFEIVCNSMDSQ